MAMIADWSDWDWSMPLSWFTKFKSCAFFSSDFLSIRLDRLNEIPKCTQPSEYVNHCIKFHTYIDGILKNTKKLTWVWLFKKVEKSLGTCNTLILNIKNHKTRLSMDNITELFCILDDFAKYWMNH